MKASEARLLDFLKKSSQFVIPIYQRTYSWTEKECCQLWDDILRTGSSDNIPLHFIGSFVYIEQGLSQVIKASPLLVIDGQQRLTTIALLLEALARAVGDSEPIDGFSAAKIRHYYLTNDLEREDRYYKLLLSQTDRASLKAIIRNTEQPKEPSLRVAQNFDLFKELLAKRSGDLAPICRGLAKLVVVDIALNRDQDNPQLIFESMNSTGRELSQADLIRNFILMGLEHSIQSHLYEQYWRPMEVDFGQEAYSAHFDGFMRHFLTLKTGDIPRQDQVYEAFKAYARSSDVNKAGVEALVKNIREYSCYFCAMALGAEDDPDLKAGFHDLREIKVDVAFPFLLELYHDYRTNELAKSEFLSVVRLIDAYIFRRAICAIPTNSLNKTFANFTKAIRKDRYLESIQAHFLGMQSYQRFPMDEEFRRNFYTRDLYHFPRRSYCLRRLENHGRKERVFVDEYTIEHIMPQNKNLSDAWKLSLGPEWQQIQQTWLHTLGNLTLTGYNSEYSDHSFTQKRDMKNGFKDSPLRLNQGLGQLDNWNEYTIEERAKTLAELAINVWAAPNLPADIIDAYKPKPAESAVYSIADHPILQTGSKRDVFEAFRKEVLAIDPCVTEDFLKLYVAYKAETNFVDVVPQAKSLRLSLNMAFVDINDPKGICRDVTNVGRWGNGDVEVKLTSQDELPYIMTLVRQSYERQMNDGNQ